MNTKLFRKLLPAIVAANVLWLTASSAQQKDTSNQGDPYDVRPIGPYAASMELGEHGLTPEQRLNIIENHLGIKNTVFKYSVAKNQKLIANFKCVVNGKPYPLSDSFSATAADSDKRNEGVIRITSAESKPKADGTTWTFCLWRIGQSGGTSFLFSSGRIGNDEFPHTVLSSTSESMATLTDDGKEHVIWRYKGADEKHIEKFSFTVSCKIVPIKENDKLGSIETVQQPGSKK